MEGLCAPFRVLEFLGRRAFLGEVTGTRMQHSRAVRQAWVGSRGPPAGAPENVTITSICKPTNLPERQWEGEGMVCVSVPRALVTDYYGLSGLTRQKFLLS